ncbi:hypothetical protein TNCV_4518771 [Trichonephila clavipes]|nr:hypothetical protein TNCV_4518771 [Trichonephila clavipes]
METLLASKMNVSPSPPPATPSIENLEAEYQSIENSASCTEFIIDIKGLMTSLDNYVFANNAAEKDRYYTRLMKIFKKYQGKKGEQENPTPPPERQTNKKLKTDDTIDTANRYDSLPVEDPPIDEENEDGDPTPNLPKYRKPPPITIDNVVNSAALLKKLQALTREDFMGRVIAVASAFTRTPPSLPYNPEFYRP